MNQRRQVLFALCLAPLTLFVQIAAGEIVSGIYSGISPASNTVRAIVWGGGWRFPAFVTGLGYVVTLIVAGPVVLWMLRQDRLTFRLVIPLGASLGGLAVLLLLSVATSPRPQFHFSPLGWEFVIAGVACGAITAGIFWLGAKPSRI